jgi:hypothetical protein
MNEVVQITERVPPRRKTKPAKGDLQYGRASTTNGDTLPGIDGRARNARRYADLIQAVTADPGQYCQRVLIRRFVGATVLAELLEARLITSSGDVSVQGIASLYQALVSMSALVALSGKTAEPKQNEQIVDLRGLIADEAERPHE